jgi:hypothetical protein
MSSEIIVTGELDCKGLNMGSVIIGLEIAAADPGKIAAMAEHKATREVSSLSSSKE